MIELGFSRGKGSRDGTIWANGDDGVCDLNNDSIHTFKALTL
jgi:hypothetical protein